MNKLFKSIVCVATGLAMAIGVGVGLGREAKAMYATTSTVALTNIGSQLGSSANTTMQTTNVTATDTSDSYTLNYYQCKKQTSSSKYAMFMTKNVNAFISNHTPIPGKITKLELFILTGAAAATTYDVAFGSTEFTSATSGIGAVNITGGNSHEYVNNSVDDALYFCITLGNANNGQVLGFTITYDDGAVKTLSSIAVSDNSGKTWRAGDVVSASDLKVVATYSNSSTLDITDGTGVTITSGATLSQGSNTVSVSYTDAFGTATGSVNITAAAAISLTSIVVTTAPTKTVYDEGEIFDPTGMVVTATFSDSSTEDVTADCTFTPSGALESGDDSITISYSYKGVEKTVSQSITVNAISEVTFSYGTDISTTLVLSKCGVTMTIGDGTWNTNSNNAYKVYKGKTLVISSGSRKMDKIEFTCTASGSAQYGPGSFGSLEGYSFDGTIGTWMGSASSVTFTASNNQVRATQIYIHFESTQKYIDLDHTEVSLFTNQVEGFAVQATVHNVESPTYTWTANNNNVTLEPNNNIVVIKPNTLVAGESEVTLTVGGVTPALTATIDVEIKVAGPGETAATAYTVAQARAAIDSGVGITNVYVTGIVSEIVTPYDSDYGNISYNISSDGSTTADQLEAFRGKSYNGAKFTSENDIEVGATVVLFGSLTNYQGTYELAAGNQLVTYLLPSKALSSITLNNQKTEFEVGDSFAFGGTVTAHYEDGSSKDVTDLAEYSGYDLSTSGTQTVTVSYTENEILKEAEYRIYVVVASAKEEFEWDLTTVTYTLSDENQTVTWSSDYAVLINTSASPASGTIASNYLGGDSNNRTSSRMYAGNVMTIYPVRGYAICSVEFAATSDNYARDFAGSTWTNARVSKEGTSVTVTPIDDSSEISAVIGGTCGFTSVTVSYKESPLMYLKNASKIATIRGTAVLNNNNEVTSVNPLELRFGIKIATNYWNTVANDSRWTIEDYGVMMFLARSAEGVPTVESRYKANSANVAIGHRNSGITPDLDGQGNYNFTVMVSVPDESYYDAVFCVAPFVKINGKYYFVLAEDIHESVRTLAVQNDGTNLTGDALTYLQGNQGGN